MANLLVKNGGGVDTYLRATGAGTDGDPLTPVHAVTGPLTDAELRAEAVAVVGPLTDAELRAEAVAVVGPLTDAELRAEAVAVVGPLTDAELRAEAVAVVGPLTNTQLRATPVTVTGSVNFSFADVEMLSYVVAIPGSFEGIYEAILAPGAGLRIVIDGLFFQLASDGPATTVALMAGGAIYRRVRLVNDGQYVNWDFERGKELRIPANMGVNLDKAGTGTVEVMMRLRYEAV